MAAYMKDPTAEIRVIVVEDDPPTLEFMAAAMRGSEGLELVGTARSVADAIALIDKEKPDAAFVDLDRVHLKLSLRDAGFGVGRKAGIRRNSKAISRASNTASGFEDKSQQISLR